MAKSPKAFGDGQAYQARKRGRPAVPVSLLSTNHWRKHSWNALRHRSGAVVIFHGSDVQDVKRRRNLCLRELNRIPVVKMRVERLDKL